ncbi:MAG TPA: anti-sigma factor [Caulobacteraceae bacterium]|jgi:anti-sigma factor RsiW|nr:anti-sigma factor [Caulobacteraceae bacterium]
MSACPDRVTLLQALFDGELDAANALAAEEHLRACQGCAAHFRMLQTVRARLAEAELSAPASPALRKRIEAMVEAEDRQSGRARPRRWWAGRAAAWSTAAAMAAIAASLLVFLAAPMRTPSLQDQLVASHVRSLMANHLTDIAASDRHVVKPWFTGKIDFAPPVVDLASEGFSLIGGRLDYADHREVAALVFRHKTHLINLFILPKRTGGLSWPAHAQPTSYSVVHWSRGGLECWAVSDVEPAQLEAFHKAFVTYATY